MGFVVPCQPGASVLLQPRWHDLARMLPAVQKIAEREAEKEGERRRRRRKNTVREREKWEDREDVRFCITEVSACHFPSELASSPMNDMAYRNG